MKSINPNFRALSKSFPKFDRREIVYSFLVCENYLFFKWQLFWLFFDWRENSQRENLVAAVENFQMGFSPEPADFSPSRFLLRAVSSDKFKKIYEPVVEGFMGKKVVSL